MQSLDDLRRIIRRIETRRPPRAAAEPLERVVGGELVETGAGSLLVVRREYPLEHRHGRVPLDGVRHAPLDVLAPVARVESEAHAAAPRPAASLAARVDGLLRRLPARHAGARRARPGPRGGRARRADPVALLRLAPAPARGAARSRLRPQPGRRAVAGRARRLVRRGPRRGTRAARRGMGGARPPLGAGGPRARARLLSLGARGGARPRGRAPGAAAPGGGGGARGALGDGVRAVGGGPAP